MKEKLLCIVFLGCISWSLNAFTVKSTSSEKESKSGATFVGYCEGTQDELKYYVPTKFQVADSISYAIALSPELLKENGNLIHAIRVALPEFPINKGKIWITNALGKAPLLVQELQETIPGWNYIPLDHPFDCENIDKKIFVGVTFWGVDKRFCLEDTDERNMNADWACLKGGWVHLFLGSYYGSNCAVGVQAMMSGGDYSKKTPQYDLAIEKVNLPAYASISEKVTCSVLVRNLGVQPVTDFKIECDLDGNKKELEVTGIFLPAGDAYNYTYETTFSETGEKKYSWELFNINGGTTDEVSGNNRESGSTDIYEKCFARTPLLERFTGQGSMYASICDYRVELAKNFGKQIAQVSYYPFDNSVSGATLGVDAHGTIANAFDVTDVLWVLLNRTGIYGSDSYSPAFNPINVLTQEAIQETLDMPAFVDIDLKKTTFNKETRTLFVKIDGEVVEDIPDLKINLFITQDSIIAPQAVNGNDYSHNDVMRATLTNNVMGDELKLSTDGTYHVEYTYTIPEIIGFESADLSHMNLVAFVSSYKDHCFKTMEVCNVRSVPLKDLSDLSFISDIQASINVGCYVEGKKIYLYGNYKQAEIYTPYGRPVAIVDSDENNIVLPVGGIYLVKILTDKGQKTFKLLLK